MWLLTFFVLNIGITIFATGLLTCRNNVNEPVDWFLLYKLPDINAHPSKLVQHGVGFMYQDANSAGQWSLSDTSINATSGHAVAYTVKQIYAKSKSTYYIMYNDDHPGEKSTGYRGHTKGVQQFDTSDGWWLIHSVPEFPGNTSFEYPKSGTRNGQSFLCVSFKTADSLNDIAAQLYLNQPSIYAQYLPKNIGSEYKLLNDVLAGKSTRKAPFTRVAQFTSAGGTRFTGFAKHRKWKNDLYSELVAPNLQQSIYTETWLNGPGDLDPECSLKFRTQDIHSIKFPEDKLRFTSSKDHSKWVSTQQPSPAPYVCIGDINRQKSQFNRGGGTMCFANYQVWKSYDSLIDTTNQCGDVKDDDNAGSIFGTKSWILSIGLVLLIFVVEMYRNKGNLSATFRSIRETVSERNQNAANRHQQIPPQSSASGQPLKSLENV